MPSRVTIRPRLLVVTLAFALVASVAGGYVLSRVLDDDDEGVDAALDEPGEYTEPTAPGQSSEGDPFPDVEVLDLDGNPVRTGAFVGEPLVVNLWYSTCPPCERELPDFAEVSAEYERRVRFVGINLIDDPDTLVEFASERGVEYEQYRDEGGAYSEAIRAVMYPTTVFVDEDGTVVEQTGPIDADGLRSRIEAML